MKKRFLAYTLSLIAIVLAFSLALAAEKTLNLAWEHNLQNEDGTTCTDLAGFRVYWSTTSGSYNIADSLEVPYDGSGAGTFTATQSITVPDDEVTTLYFVCTAYDESGNESDWSNEASKVIDFLAPASTFNLEVTIVAQ